MAAFARTSGTFFWWMRSASPSTMAVLPTPGSPTKTGLFLRRRQSTWMVRSSSASRPMSGSMCPCAARSTRLTVKVRNGSFTGRGAPSSSPSPSPVGPRPAALLAVLADAVRDVLEDVEPPDPLLLEQVDRVRAALAGDGHQHVAGVELAAAGALHVPGGALEHALEGRGLLGILLRAHRLEGAVEVLLELLLEQLQVGAAGEQHLRGDLVLGHRVEQVLQRHVLVTPSPGLGHRRLEGLL